MESKIVGRCKHHSEANSKTCLQSIEFKYERKIEENLFSIADIYIH